MELSKKLQELRKRKGIIQEELAIKLYVSRTAVSKWESGRGYPNIDSLKSIANIFEISIDELLSSNELLDFTERDKLENKRKLKILIMGLLDFFMLALLFLPLFGIRENGMVVERSLLGLYGIKLYLHISYYIVVIFPVVYSVIFLILKTYSTKISLTLNVLSTIVFIATMQVYACVFVFLLFIIKVTVLQKLFRY